MEIQILQQLHKARITITGLDYVGRFPSLEDQMFKGELLEGLIFILVRFENLLQIDYFGMMHSELRKKFEESLASDLRFQALKFQDLQKLRQFERELQFLTTYKMDLSNVEIIDDPKVVNSEIEYWNQPYISPRPKGRRVSFKEGMELFDKNHQKIFSVIELAISKLINGVVDGFTSSEFYQQLQIDLSQRGVPSTNIKATGNDVQSERITFSCGASNKEALNDLFDSLKVKRLISQDTSRADFKSIFGLNNRSVKIDWIASLAELNCFLRNVPNFFKEQPDFPHFVAGANCFTVNGKEVSPGQISNNRFKDNTKSRAIIGFLMGLESYQSKSK